MRRSRCPQQPHIFMSQLFTAQPFYFQNLCVFTQFRHQYIFNACLLTNKSMGRQEGHAYDRYAVSDGSPQGSTAFLGPSTCGRQAAGRQPHQWGDVAALEDSSTCRQGRGLPRRRKHTARTHHAHLAPLHLGRLLNRQLQAVLAAVLHKALQQQGGNSGMHILQTGNGNSGGRGDGATAWRTAATVSAPTAPQPAGRCCQVMPTASVAPPPASP